ncbi:hypothetical protein [Mitsuaria sp. GD03876]|uniref:hypothetical protein n=1 Tax=Mitsuaria sp. GD03876 TaxID=2975399 RepID=UPI00244AF621|nr:hypothetical protein [Mitsuaria sp. GD03876]MDH0864866.1 hypothetical protein [Mitsuaria sp. GD03876]
MIDFADCIRAGIDNAITAEGERAEIQRILDQVDAAIRSATSGKARLVVGKFHGAKDDAVAFTSKLRHRLVIQSVLDEQEGWIIAGWDTSSEGAFAVQLVYEFQSLHCEDGDELMEELGNLLETARVGRAIQHFANR